MGVGLYCKDLDPDYCNLVLEMLSDRQLAYVIADESFCYGANYQISNVLINDDIGNSHSINTILQLIGRTSRVGKSWSGKVYLDKNTCNRIVQFLNDPKDNSNEGQNISKSFDSIVDKIYQENEIIKQKLLEIELLKQKEEELKRLEKEKEEEAIKIANDKKIERMETEKQSWRNARNAPRPERKNITVENNNYIVPKNTTEKINDDNDDWSKLRKERVKIIPSIKKDELYKPGMFSKSNIVANTENTNKPTNSKIATNQTFRQQREDELMNNLFNSNRRRNANYSK